MNEAAKVVNQDGLFPSKGIFFIGKNAHLGRAKKFIYKNLDLSHNDGHFVAADKKT